MAERDPRKDPQPGDVLKEPDEPSIPGVPRGIAARRTVEYVYFVKDKVRWSGPFRETTKSYECSLATWRKWASTAEVVRTTGAGEGK